LIPVAPNRNTATAAIVVAFNALWPVFAWAGPPFATDDPEPTEYQHFEIYLYSEASWAGDSQGGTAMGLEVNYGLLPNLQITASLPVGFDLPDDARARFGIGEAEIGAKYRFIEEDSTGWMPQVSFFPSVEAALVRSGSTTGDRATHVFLPLWAQKSFGEWTTFGGGGYRINDGTGTRDSWFVGWAAVKQMDDDWHLGAEIYRESAQTNAGNGVNAFSIGATYDFSDRWHVVGSAGAGFEDHSGAATLSTYVALEWTP
jgi:hypothetical protein